MIFNTKGIVLRTIKYGETSVVVTIFTELFGIQPYLVNGVRTSSKNSKAHFFQPSSILDLQVYHNELKNLQRIKEVKWNYLYKNILSEVLKNAIALYMVELLQKCLKQPENNTELFEFVEDALMVLDVSDDAVAANFPLYFSLQLTQFFGFTIQNTFSNTLTILDLEEGTFIETDPHHQHFLEAGKSQLISELMKVQHPSELSQISLNKFLRRDMLLALQTFYMLHLPDFGVMKTLPVLQEILS